MVVWCGYKNPSLGITVLHHSAKTRDDKQWPSDRFFYPHLTPMKDSCGGITVWHHSAQSRDAKQWHSDGFFCLHLTPMQDYKNLSWVWSADIKISPRVTVCNHESLPSDAKQDPKGRIFLSVANNHDRFFFLHTFWSPVFNFNAGVATNEWRSYVLTTELRDLLYNQSIENTCCYSAPASDSCRQTVTYTTDFLTYFNYNRAKKRFSSLLNLLIDVLFLMSAGKLFHNFGPWTENALSK